MTNHLFMERQSDTDITKHLEALKARLGFARFKLRNGWENNTLLDVESFWRERQRQLVDNLPTPRFRQKDILDNRTLHPHHHYHQPTTGTRIQLNKNENQYQRRYSHHSQEKKRRTKLTRPHSAPTTSTSQTQFIFPSQAHHNYDNIDDDDDDDYHYTYSMDGKRKRLMSHTPPSPLADDYIINYSKSHDSNNGHAIQSRRTRSSLDCLSYAISMKEKDQHSRLDMENSSPRQDSESGTDATHHDSDDSDQYIYANQPPMLLKTPSSPVTAAAETMMMFGHHHTQII